MVKDISIYTKIKISFIDKMYVKKIYSNWAFRVINVNNKTVRKSFPYVFYILKNVGNDDKRG